MHAIIEKITKENEAKKEAKKARKAKKAKANSLTESKPVMCGEAFYAQERKDDLEMLENHALVHELDGPHSIELIERNLKHTKPTCTALEIGPGNARVTATVLMKKWCHIEAVEPSQYLREQAKVRMKELGQPYEELYECTV